MTNAFVSPALAQRMIDRAARRCPYSGELSAREKRDAREIGMQARLRHLQCPNCGAFYNSLNLIFPAPL